MFVGSKTSPDFPTTWGREDDLTIVDLILFFLNRKVFQPITAFPPIHSEPIGHILDVMV